MSEMVCTVQFSSEAYETAANMLQSLKGLTVTVSETRAGESWDAELVDLSVDKEDGQWKAELAPWVEEAGCSDHDNIRVLDIYDDIDTLEVT